MREYVESKTVIASEAKQSNFLSTGKEAGLLCRVAPRNDGETVLAAYSPQAANASLNARSPGAPFSIAMIARRWLT
jgi:hypothetical protein